MRPIVSILLFFIILVILRAVHKTMSGFKGGFGAGVGGSGAAYQQIGFQDLNEAELVYQKQKEAFRGGEAIGGHTAGESNLGDLGSSASVEEQEQRRRDQVEEAFQNIGTAGDVTGKPETEYIDGPADASLKQPRKPYNLLEQLPPAPRGSISCLNAACCAETDFEWRTNLTGNFLQRTNNYKREFPDSCSAPLTELNLAFYKNSVLPKVT
ncbi:MAG: hypothetical protein EBU82_07195 [Flavobacteriia bacterium]|jgi:hypothetical protein|nr:hypothetical protein [Flavobacteriia bacterium]